MLGFGIIKREKGFTLVELLIVVIILAILILGIGIWGVNLTRNRTDSQEVDKYRRIATINLQRLSKRLRQGQLIAVTPDTLSFTIPSFCTFTKDSSSGNATEQYYKLIYNNSSHTLVQEKWEVTRNSAGATLTDNKISASTGEPEYFSFTGVYRVESNSTFQRESYSVCDASGSETATSKDSNVVSVRLRFSFSRIAASTKPNPADADPTTPNTIEIDMTTSVFMDVERGTAN